ncbi:MAG TPA: hypothetical protein PLD27_11710 [bacterium]|nr:hypothetical protein [bacterium]HOL48445.1 hypothetical protein [bacterium]HPQ19745.1 hypothetical protein [bacterium]
MEYRNLKLNEYNLVKEFYESFYGKNYSCITKQYFDWYHYKNPFRFDDAKDEYTSLCAFDNKNQIVASINYLPTYFYIGEKKYKSAWSTDILTNKNYSFLYPFLLKKNLVKYDFYLSMGPSERVKNICVSQFGFEYRHNIPRVIIVSNASQLIELLKLNQQNRELNFVKLYDYEKMTNYFAEYSEYFILKSIKELNEEYWFNLLEKVKATVIKDKAYINWRYLEHPFMKYYLISESATQKAGLAVVRIEKIRDLDFQVMRILEFIPITGFEKKLISSICRFSLDNNITFIDFFCGAENFVLQLPKPFLQMEEHLQYNIPRLFQPLEWRERYSLNFLFWQKKENKKKIKINEIYFTKGDAGQDVMLNKEYKTKGF